jgi:hypothetical protein
LSTGGASSRSFALRAAACEDLENLAFLAEGGTLVSKVESAPEAVLTRIEEVAAGAGPTDLESWVRVILQLVSRAADEYAIGIKHDAVHDDAPDQRGGPEATAGEARSLRARAPERRSS